MSAEGQAILNGLNQLEQCAMGLKADIQALEQQLNSKLDTAEKPSIIQQSVTEATLLLDPKILAVQTAIGVAMQLAQGASIKAGTAFSKAQTAAGIANAAKTTATQALDLGELASIKAGNAFHKATQAGQVAQSAQSAAQTATTTANTAKGVAQNALGKAGDAFGKATDALSKVGNLALQVLNLAGAVAGLLSLYGLINSVFPRLDAHDAQLSQHSQAISDSISLAHSGIIKANNAQTKADNAYQIATNAAQSAEAANITANIAQANSEQAQQDANYAVEQANYAIDKANQAINSSATALSKSNQAISTSEFAITKADAAISKVNLLEPKVANAQSTADYAVDKAVGLEPKVANAQGTADDAKALGIQNQTRIQILEPKVEQAQNTADQANTKAQEAKDWITVWEPKIVNAQTTSTTALGLAAPAFTATQLQATELKATELRVTALEAKTFTPTIIQNNTYQATPAQITDITNQVTNNVTNNLQGQLQQVNNNTTNITNIQNVINNGVAMTPQQELKIDNTLLGLAALTTLVNGIPGAVTTNLRPPIDAINNQTKPSAIIDASAAGTCRTTQPGGCMRNLVDNSAANAANNAANNAVGNVTNNINNALDLAGLGLLKIIDNKLGAQIANGGISGAMGRLSNFLGVGRAFQFMNLITNIHNAYMLSNALKTTLLEMISSVGNATGLMQTPEGENVDLNAEYNKGMDIIMKAVLGEALADDVKSTWKKYNRIYQAATNSVQAFSNMMNAVANVVQISAEHTGRIGNSLKAAGVVAEDAFAWMSEKINAKMSRFLTFNTTVGNTTAFLEVINEIAQTVVEGQQAATEFQTANTEFIKAVKDAPRDKGFDNTATATAETTAKTQAATLPPVTAGKTENEDMADSLISKLFD